MKASLDLSNSFGCTIIRRSSKISVGTAELNYLTHIVIRLYEIFDEDDDEGMGSGGEDDNQRIGPIPIAKMIWLMTPMLFQTAIASKYRSARECRPLRLKQSPSAIEII